jgi:hypothetical protein
MGKQPSAHGRCGDTYSTISAAAGNLSIAQLRRKYGAAFAIEVHGQFRFKNVADILDEESLRMLASDPPLPGDPSSGTR